MVWKWQYAKTQNDCHKLDLLIIYIYMKHVYVYDLGFSVALASTYVNFAYQCPEALVELRSLDDSWWFLRYLIHRPNEAWFTFSTFDNWLQDTSAVVAIITLVINRGSIRKSNNIAFFLSILPYISYILYMDAGTATLKNKAFFVSPVFATDIGPQIFLGWSCRRLIRHHS